MRIFFATSIMLLSFCGIMQAEELPALPSGTITTAGNEAATAEQKRRQTIDQQMQAKSISLDVREVPLHEFIETLSKQANVPMSLDNAALQEMGLSRNAKVTIQAKNLSASSVLDLALQKYGLTYVPREDGIEITSREERDSILHVRTYSLTALLQDSSGTIERWQEIITGNLAKESWEVLGGPGSVRAFGNSLVVSQTEEVHAEIDYFLTLAAQAKQFSSDDYPVKSLLILQQDQATHNLREQLTTTEIEIAFQAGTLRQAVEALNKKGAFKIQIDEQALIAQNQNASMSVTLSPGSRSFQRTLDELLRPAGLVWCVSARDNSVVITTPYTNCFTEEPRLYPVRDLVWHGLKVEKPQQRQTLAEITHWQGKQWREVAILKSVRAPGVPALPDFATLDQLIQGTIEPGSWEALGGPGTLQFVEEIDCLLIYQRPEVHDAIAHMLHQVRQQQSPDAPQKLREQIEKTNAEIISVRYPLVWNSATADLDETGFNDLTRLIRSGTDEASWQKPEASLHFAYRDLVVRQRRDVQRQVLSILRELDLIYLTPKVNSPEQAPPGQYLGGGGGGFF